MERAPKVVGNYNSDVFRFSLTHNINLCLMIKWSAEQLSKDPLIMHQDRMVLSLQPLNFQTKLYNTKVHCVSQSMKGAKRDVVKTVIGRVLYCYRLPKLKR